MSEKKASSPDRVKKKLAKVSDHLKSQNETLRKMLGKLSEDVEDDKNEKQ
jgi:hypothetical protein